MLQRDLPLTEEAFEGRGAVKTGVIRHFGVIGQQCAPWPERRGLCFIGGSSAAWTALEARDLKGFQRAWFGCGWWAENL